MSRQVLQQLRKFTSCDIGDALIKLKYPNGGFLDGISMRSPSSAQQPGQHAGGFKIFGPALTVEMVEMSATSAPKPPKHFADCVEPGSVMYIKQPKGLPSACWGGLMSTRAKYLGGEAVVVDGRIRDVEEHREMGFPVFSKSTSILGSNTFTRASQINVPLQFDKDLWIHPGDILIGDADGVVVTPPSLIEQVVALCEERFEMDQKMFKGLGEGKLMGELISKLRK